MMILPKSSRHYVRTLVVLTMMLWLPMAESSRGIFGGSRFPVAAIFGNPKDRDTAEETPPIQIITPPPPPPPPSIPPPPPPKLLDSMAVVKEEITEVIVEKDPQEEETTSISNPQEPTITESWSLDNQQQQQQQYMPPQHLYHVPPQQYYYDEQQQQQEQQQQDPYHHWPPPLSLEQQLEESRAREQELLAQIHNLTETNQHVQQQDQIHSRQMDVLTERIMEAEAQIAHESNRVLEYQANCTAMGRQMAVVHQELADWQSRCASFADEHATSQTKIKELKKNLADARAKAENLAISIENARIRDQMDLGLSKKKKKKKQSLLGWVFSFLWSSAESSSESDDEEYQSPQELAKSTLLRALQIERDNIDELESAMASLQSNNSAIAEMVKSRDMIIDELNDRVAVFEEDKVVLKAALKQLQKEMKEEAPRTEKLLADLETARQENVRLAGEIESLVEMHQGEINTLSLSIAEAQNAANASESNLTAIGQYVDTLEQRLASFAIIRRDVELREQKCKQVEEHALQVEEERDNLRAKIEEFEVEQSDLKALFEELVQEQTKLRGDKAELEKERDALLEGAQRSREALASLEVNMKQRDNDIEEWRSKAVELENELNSTKQVTTEVEKGMQEVQAGKEDLAKQVVTMKSFSEELQAKLDSKTEEIAAMKEQLAIKASELKKNEEELSSRAAEFKRIHEELEERNEKVKTQEAELANLKELAQKPQPQPLPKEAEPVELESVEPKPVEPERQSIDPVNASEAEESPSEVNSNSTLPDQNKTTSTSNPPVRLPNNRKPPTAPKADSAKPKKRNVPLRGVRKIFAKTTGIHGAFTPPSTKRETPKGSSRPTRQSAKKGPPPKRAPPRQIPPPKGSYGARNAPPRKIGSPPPRMPGPPIHGKADQPDLPPNKDQRGPPPLPTRSFGKP
ncbi:Inherit from NOG: keratin, type II cytoskeletal [Seminavis robusta]|uniref:Inherit from NOG: keratin, type II cytoskeletal n=1 Tax=Seminavis robusta TaxID=568900 RepID=A0A9N8ENF3_9STRA|nr:Inherit from NOG: keratin, type II cytoskeletal [Seminavis robusta]|eukprot:Sro1312_g261830.1 Inherit from NOG: keratin, type II cytoskeletal (920) ;mRNA; r:18007-21040